MRPCQADIRALFDGLGKDSVPACVCHPSLHDRVLAVIIFYFHKMHADIRATTDRPTKQGFSKTLEAKAEQIAERLTHKQWDYLPESFLEREIAHALGQLNRTRVLHQQLRRGLLREECYVDTELLRIDQPRYPIYHYQRHRAWLKDKLHAIERERRHLAQVEDQTVQGLHDRLLELLHRHQHISIENGN